MGKPADLKGVRFGYLVGVERVENRGERTFWLFKCDCGNIKEMGIAGIMKGTVVSCGCYQRARISARTKIHGHCKGKDREKISPEYRAWRHAINRCHNPNVERYPLYGGRGIKVCDEWRNSFVEFLRHMGPKPVGMTLDRIDVNRGYEPGNCRWATVKEQARNKRNNVRVNFNGRDMTLKEFAELVGANYKKLSRIYRQLKISPVKAAEIILGTELQPDKSEGD